MQVTLIDYDAGNLASMAHALEHAGANVRVGATAADIRSGGPLVLPGVGAFGHCAARLRAVPGLVEALDEAVLTRGRPFLGVCVGMQLMAEAGEEHGPHRGLGWLGGVVRRIRPDLGVRVPHLGWNRVQPTVDDPVLREGHGYFAHGYALEGAAPGEVAALVDHGGPRVAAVRCGSALGLQFHPEKSQTYGLATLARWLRQA